MAVKDGRIMAVGEEAEIGAVTGPPTSVIDAGGAMVMPGIVDAHIHVSAGGQQMAWELAISPAAGLDEIMAAVSAHAGGIGANDWVIGGSVGSGVLQHAGTRDALAALDKAGRGRPVLLRDDSSHNRWANSRAMELLGISAATPDPADGRYVRDSHGDPVGVILEQASQRAEQGAREHMRDLERRDRHSARTALSLLNSLGVTAVQDAATMGTWLETFSAMDRAGELTMWLVASMPNIHYMVTGAVFPELADQASAAATEHVRPTFAKFLLDGVPMTRTSAFLHPYKADPQAPASGSPGHDPGFRGTPYYTHASLMEVFEQAVARGMHVKAHATADLTARQVLDCVEEIRKRHGYGTIFHIAHSEFIDRDDIPRFRDLGVVADASPLLWLPHLMNQIIAQQVQEHYMERIWPLRELHQAGALIAAGSDWPSGSPMPDPWLSIEAMITRRNPDPAYPGTLAADQALDLTTALEAHTVNAAQAIGLSQETGQLRAGLSADFIMLDRNLYRIPAEQIHNTRIQQTWFAGRLVHEAEPA
jgi:predicted amidohydrolase YtcJ